MSNSGKHYKQWTSAETVNWIISLNPSRYEQYRNTLTSSFHNDIFSGSSLDDLDREDLKSYGIINLEDRKSIYKSIIKLMANQKRRDSQIKEIPLVTEQQPLSLSDDEYTDGQNHSSQPHYGALLTTKQLQQLQCDGYCEMQDETDDPLLMGLVSGWVRCNHDGQGITTDIVNAIVYFHGAKYDIEEYVQIRSGDEEPILYLTRKINMRLSKLLWGQAEDILDCQQVPARTLIAVFRYLDHHKGIEPDPLPCPVRSIHMDQIVSDKWDATYIDSYDKKSIFEIILAANYMDIKCLVHLGSAKIATLIKQLDQQEINRIIADEEQYRREHAQETVDNGGNEEE
eukprot:464381_1